MLRLNRNYCCHLKEQYLLRRVCCIELSIIYFDIFSCSMKLGIMRMLFFKKFFETLWKISVFLKNYCTNFQKSGTYRKSAHSPVCVHTPLLSFFSHTTFYSLRKNVWGTFDPNFWIFALSRKLIVQILDFGFNG